MFRTKSQKMLRASGQKIKLFVIAGMHFAQRVLSYSGTAGGKTKAERGGRGRQKERRNKEHLRGGR